MTMRARVGAWRLWLRGTLVAMAMIWLSGHARSGDQRIQVLFLGDAGHHQPSERARQLIPVMDRAGIDVQYTEDLNQLSLSNLQKFDALMVYANIDNLDDQRAAAILELLPEVAVTYRCTAHRTVSVINPS